MGTECLYTMDAFDKEHFPANWYRVRDDGCQVEFPVRMVSRLKWAKTVYTNNGDIIEPKKKYFDACIVWIVKQRSVLIWFLLPRVLIPTLEVASGRMLENPAPTIALHKVEGHYSTKGRRVARIFEGHVCAHAHCLTHYDVIPPH